MFSQFEGVAAGVWAEKEHLRTKPPSEPTRKMSGSQGDRATEVTPTLLLPLAYGSHGRTNYVYQWAKEHTPLKHVIFAFSTSTF